MSDVIAQMLASRRLERVAVNRDHATGVIDMARRQVRKATEYPSDDRPTATKQDVTEAISAASAIVAACEEYLR